MKTASEPSLPASDTANADVAADEISSLLSTSTGPGDQPEDAPQEYNHSQHPDVTGFALFKIPEFYLIWTLVGTLTGIGLMTINNIGNDTQALWLKYDGTMPKSFIMKRQLFHVSVISFFSFCGRLLSGIGSDVLVKKLHTSRFWCLVASGSIFMCAQIAALNVENPHFLIFVSGLTGLAYGVLFGVSPSVVADAFGVHVLASNWGIMMLGPVLFGNVFNVCYGRIFDHNSLRDGEGEFRCTKGLACYRNAYWVTFFTSLIAIAVSVWTVRHDMRRKRLEADEQHQEDEHMA